MTRRERVIAAIRHDNPDFTPYDCSLTSQQWEIFTAFTGDPNYLEKCNLHMHGFGYDGNPRPIPGVPEHVIDDFGVVWNRSGADKDIGVIENPLIPDLETMHYEFPPVDEVEIRRAMEEMLDTREDKFVSAGIGFSMFERAWSLCGMENLLMGMLTCPQQVETLLNGVREYDEKILDILLSYPIDAVYFGDDWGQQKNLIMGPALWRTFIKPQMKQLYEKAKNQGKYVLQHSCGDIWEIFDDLVEIGLDVYQTFQPEIYDVVKFKEKYGRDKLTVWGGISTQHILHSGTPTEVEAETRRIMKILGEGGGLIAAPTHGVPQDVSPQNLLAMLKVFTEQQL